MQLYSQRINTNLLHCFFIFCEVVGNLCVSGGEYNIVTLYMQLYYIHKESDNSIIQSNVVVLIICVVSNVCTKIHGVTEQQTAIVVVSTVRASIQSYSLVLMQADTCDDREGGKHLT